MRFNRTRIPGLLEILPPLHEDERGTFVKTVRRDLFAAHGVKTVFEEEYYTRSRQGVLRGLHFQLPPADHAKLVLCADGEALDAVVDLRAGSPTYGLFEIFPLCGAIPKVLYIPPGLAHGFLVTGPHALMFYKTTSAYSPEHDSGILWSSAGIPWPVAAPVLSARDRAFPPLSGFRSPFRFRDGGAGG